MFSDAEVQINLQKQLKWNKNTFAMLKEAGLRDESEVELDFSYVSSDERLGEELAELLINEFDYKVKTYYHQGKFMVDGTTGKTKLSLQLLDQWVNWMCNKGSKYQCMFNGWGTSVPRQNNGTSRP